MTEILVRIGIIQKHRSNKEKVL